MKDFEKRGSCIGVRRARRQATSQGEGEGRPRRADPDGQSLRAELEGARLEPRDPGWPRRRQAAPVPSHRLPPGALGWDRWPSAVRGRRALGLGAGTQPPFPGLPSAAGCPCVRGVTAQGDSPWREGQASREHGDRAEGQS